MSVNSTSNLEGDQKYRKPQINKYQLSKNGHKQSYNTKPDKIYQHHFNKKQESKDQIKKHHLPQLQQIKQPQQMNQPYEPKDQLITKEEMRKTHTNQGEKDGSENEEENYKQGGTRYSYYPDPKPNYYSLSRYPLVFI